MPTLLRPGQRADRYRVVRLLGMGGMAEVWEVSEPGRSRRLALKVARGRDPTDARRLLREGRAAAELEHPNLLRVLDVVPVAGGAGLVLPLVDGPALDQVLRAGRLSEADALTLFCGIVRGVAHAHSLGLVHRDLKPGNILLDLSSGQVTPKVSDFGLVIGPESAEQTTPSGAALGTPAYAAPEQLRDSAGVDARADLWSLGVIFVELLTGQRPFVGRGVVETSEAHAAGPALDGLRPELAALAARLLTVSLADRTQTASALLLELDALGSESHLDAGSPLFQTSAALARRGDETADPVSLTDGGPPGASTLGLSTPPPVPRRLPLERDAFIGREQELRALDEALCGDARLVTVRGTRGLGKTRLAVRYGWTHLSEWPGGVVFCDLSGAGGAEGAAEALAGALGVSLGEGDPVRQLGGALAARGRCLIFLDDLSEGARRPADTMARWLAAAPEARVVVTTTGEPLGLGGRDLLLAPLRHEDAAALFVARAADARPELRGSPADLQAVDALVGRLDGLPLAIELAAAQARALSPQAMLRELDARFGRLNSSGRPWDLEATLRATLCWSWARLSEDEREALAQLAVFEGDFSLTAAEAALSLAATWPLDAIQALIERAWLRRVGEDRYAIPRALKEHAARWRLASSAKAGPVLR